MEFVAANEGAFFNSLAVVFFAGCFKAETAGFCILFAGATDVFAVSFFLSCLYFTDSFFFAGIPNTTLVRSFFSVIRSLVDFLFLGVTINFKSRSDFLILSTVSFTLTQTNVYQIPFSLLATFRLPVPPDTIATSPCLVRKRSRNY